MKAYLAAPIFTAHQLAVVGGIQDLLEHLGYEVFSPYHASRAIWNGRAPSQCTEEERQAVLKGNIMNLDRPTSLLVAWVGGTEDGRTDTGVTWELGYFHNRVVRNDYYHESGNGVPPMTLAYIDPQDKRQNMNLMLAGTIDAVARGGTELQRALSLHAAGLRVQMMEEFHPSRNILHEGQEMIK